MQFEKWAKIFVGLALLMGLILSIVSFLHLCTAECKAGEDWKLFGFSFGPLGIAYFATLLILHLVRWQSWVALGLAAGLGAEVVLISIQKYQIGHWCPVCLAIAGSVGVASLIYGFQFLKDLQTSTKGEKMKKLIRSLTTVSFFALGFIVFFIGIAKENQVQALETNIKDKMAFGKLDSPLTVFLFTDWACPACRALEPKIAQLFPVITEKARFIFVDVAVHPETLNYSPYNLSFMIHNKPQYLALRQALTNLSADVTEPTDTQINKIANDQGVKLVEMHYAEVALGLKYWNELEKQFDIDGTPILVIVNAQNKKGKKLAGLEEITESNILKAMESLK